MTGNEKQIVYNWYGILSLLAEVFKKGKRPIVLPFLLVAFAFSQQNSKN